MMQKNPFLKYIMKDKKEDIFHSSAYAKAQSGGNIGAASSESYNVRVNIGQNRTKIKGYGDSELMMGSRENGPRAKTYTPLEKEATGGARGNIGGGISGATNRARMAAKNPGISVKR